MAGFFMPYYVYLIQSERTGKLYKGLTGDIAKRLASHRAGKVRSTKGSVPWTIVYSEEFDTREEARKREVYFKSGYGRSFLRSKGIE
jgi:putative endonuclease